MHLQVSVVRDHSTFESLFFFFSLTLLLKGLHSEEYMSLVEGGSFPMGQANALDDEQPVRFVSITTFHIDKTEVTINFWRKIEKWAVKSGYRFSSGSSNAKRGLSWHFADTGDYPMNMVNWYDAVKWSNARSEFMGRQPVYFTDSKKDTIYKTGEIEIDETCVNWTGTGYRLPSEAEWEKAARGGIQGKNYPWGNFIDGSLANYKRSGDPFDDAATPVGYFNGEQIITSNVNSLGGENKRKLDVRNNYQLYDITGNVGEWTWDWYQANWYSNSKASVTDPKGPELSDLKTSEQYKVYRGGDFRDSPNDEERSRKLRIAFRHVANPEFASRTLGFRCIRSDAVDELWIEKQKIGSVESKWFYVNWLGSFFQSKDDWVYHEEWGWIYPTGFGSYDNWIYFPKVGWVWTSKFAYPYFYSSPEGEWYQRLFENPRSGWFERQYDKHLSYWGR